MFIPIKIDQKQATNLLWNLPEQPFGSILNIGGNSTSCLSTIKNSEFLLSNFQLNSLTTLLPLTLKSKLPKIDHFAFAPATASGSFANSQELLDFFSSSSTTSTDLVLFSGEFSKNQTTIDVVTDVLNQQTKPTIVARDTIDLISEHPKSILENPNLILIASLAQLQKLFRAVYYPKLLLLSQPLLAISETLHKFTLSYQITLLTYCDQQIILASQGKVYTLPIENTPFKPFSLFTSTLPATISALNLYNPNQAVLATASACLYR